MKRKAVRRNPADFYAVRRAESLHRRRRSRPHRAVEFLKNPGSIAEGFGLEIVYFKLYVDSRFLMRLCLVVD